MKKLFRILIVSLVIIFATNNIFAAADTNVTKESHVWIKNNSDYPLNIFVERIETLIPDSSINYFCWGSCYPPFVSISTDVVTILSGEMDKMNFIGDYVINGGDALTDTAQITYCFIDDCYSGNFKCFTALYSLEGPADSLYPMIVFDTSYCGITTSTPNKEIEDILINNKMFDVLGRELINYDDISFGTLFIQNGKKYIKINY